MDKREVFNKWLSEKNEWMDVWEAAIKDERPDIAHRARLHVALINQFLSDLQEME
jgi:hypothetical protein